MALPVYYLNQSWSQTYGEMTNQIVTRAFAIFACIIYEFRNKENRNRSQTKAEFIRESNRVIIDELFDSLLQSYYSNPEVSSPDTKLKSSVMHSLSFNLSPYVKMLPKFDAIPVIISCLRQDDIRIVKIATETLTLLCQWNGSFVKTITDYMFSSALFTLLDRLRYNILHGLSINHFTKKKGSILRMLRSPTSRDEDLVDEKRSVFSMDTQDTFLTSLGICNDPYDSSLQAVFYCPEDKGQELLLHSVLLLIVYMEGSKKVPGAPVTDLLAELHASDCEYVLMGILDNNCNE